MSGSLGRMMRYWFEGTAGPCRAGEVTASMPTLRAQRVLNGSGDVLFDQRPARFAHLEHGVRAVACKILS